jgi:hypothetical protein
MQWNCHHQSRSPVRRPPLRAYLQGFDNPAGIPGTSPLSPVFHLRHPSTPQILLLPSRTLHDHGFLNRNAKDPHLDRSKVYGRMPARAPSSKHPLSRPVLFTTWHTAAKKWRLAPLPSSPSSDRALPRSLALKRLKNWTLSGGYRNN